MTRSWIGVALLVLFLLIGIFTGILMESSQSKTEQLLTSAADQILSGDSQQAIRLGTQALHRWQHQRKLTAVVADHTPMEDIDALFAQMETYAQTGELPHFAACCKELASRIAAVAEAHQFSWWNIL